MINIKDFKDIKKWMVITHSLLLWWLTVDFAYIMYHAYNNNVYYRESNLIASTVLYALNGLLLCYKGTFKELLVDIKKLYFVKR